MGSGPLAILIGALLFVSACSGATTDRPRIEQAKGPGGETRTLRMAERTPPQDLAPKIPTAGMADRTKRLFNAFLAVKDDGGTPHPYLAEILPQLNTENWRVFPDGRMETTYRLRTALQWHDGRPLTADDFVFAFRAYSNPDLGLFSPQPQDQIAEVIASDPQTVLIRWASPFPGAGTLAQGSFDPLPRHILEEPLLAVERDPGTRDTFANLRYWTDEYVGAGPYRLVRWDRGVSIEGAAFDAHALGRPNISRIIRYAFSDENTVLANVLGGEIDFADVRTLRSNHGQTLQHEWVAAGKGRLLYLETAPLAPFVQFRPEYQKSPPLLDLRVRRALAHGIDKDQVSEAIYPGSPSTRAETLISRLEPYYDQVDRALAKYPYDPRQTAMLMGEAGLAKDRDGFYTDVQGARFRPEFQVTPSLETQRMQLVMSETWQRDGIDVQPVVLPDAQIQDAEGRAKFAGLATVGSALGVEREQVARFTAPQIATAANRWRGFNPGWPNPVYDQLFEEYDRTLDRSQQVTYVVEMMKLLSEEVPILPVYYNLYTVAMASDLQGPTISTAGSVYWNIQDWQIGGAAGREAS
jgi:peptide/nickel transport system substrate-binding protein